MSFVCAWHRFGAQVRSAEQARRARLARLNLPPGGAGRVLGLA